jgi:hypothetical protein
VRRGRVNGGDEGEGIWLVDTLHIHIQNSMMKPLEIALSGVGRSLQGAEGGDGGGNLTNVLCETIQN